MSHCPWFSQYISDTQWQHAEQSGLIGHSCKKENILLELKYCFQIINPAVVTYIKEVWDTASIDSTQSVSESCGIWAWKIMNSLRYHYFPWHLFFQLVSICNFGLCLSLGVDQGSLSLGPVMSGWHLLP